MGVRVTCAKNGVEFVVRAQVRVDCIRVLWFSVGSGGLSGGKRGNALDAVVRGHDRWAGGEGFLL